MPCCLSFGLESRLLSKTIKSFISKVCLFQKLSWAFTVGLICCILILKNMGYWGQEKWISKTLQFRDRRQRICKNFCILLFLSALTQKTSNYTRIEQVFLTVGQSNYQNNNTIVYTFSKSIYIPYARHYNPLLIWNHLWKQLFEIFKVLVFFTITIIFQGTKLS